VTCVFFLFPHKNVLVTTTTYIYNFYLGGEPPKPLKDLKSFIPSRRVNELTQRGRL